jgi:hypothetical protein
MLDFIRLEKVFPIGQQEYQGKDLYSSPLP